MKKLTLRTEHLGELSTDELRKVAGAAGGAYEAPGTVSDGSCVCGIGIVIRQPQCDISDGSCVCTIGTR